MGLVYVLFLIMFTIIIGLIFLTLRVLSHEQDIYHICEEFVQNAEELLHLSETMNELYEAMYLPDDSDYDGGYYDS